MKAILKLFIPNGVTSNRVALGLIISQIILGLIMCIVCPFALLPKPMDILYAWVNLFNNMGLANQLCSSMVVNIEAILLSTIISLVLAYSTVILFMRPIVGIISKFRFSSLTGFVFYFTVLFGIGHGLKVSLLTFGMTVFLVTSLYRIVEEIPKEEFDHARTLGMSEWQVVLEVVILGRLDFVCEALRQNAAIGWMMLTMVEGLSRSEGGIGTLLLNENKQFQLAPIFALQFTVLIIGIFQDKLLLFTKNKCFPYSQLAQERK